MEIVIPVKSLVVKMHLVEADQENLYDRIQCDYFNPENLQIPLFREPETIPLSAKEIKGLTPKISSGELEIRTSSIPNTGNGTYAGRDFEKGEIISYYSGPILPFSEVRALPYSHQTHALSIVTGGFYVIVGNERDDGSGALVENPGIELRDGGIGPFLNDARDERNNVQFMALDSRVNQEIFVTAIKNGRTRDPNNKFLVRTLLPVFDRQIGSGALSQGVKGKTFFIGERVMIVHAMRNIRKGEELFVSYGDNYKFFGEEEEEQKKRPVEEGDLRGKEGRKRIKFGKCLSCSDLTEYTDYISGGFLCSPECVGKHYDENPNILTFYHGLLEHFEI